MVFALSNYDRNLRAESLCDSAQLRSLSAKMIAYPSDLRLTSFLLDDVGRVTLGNGACLK